MLGNSPGFRRRALVLSLLLIGLASLSCARTIKQDAHTGKDGKYKGAKTITLEGNAAEVSGIVTYPGGDRVDWRVIELPADKSGKLDLELSWRPPRPGLDLAFDVYDQYGTKIGSVKSKISPFWYREMKNRLKKNQLVRRCSKGIWRRTSQR